MSAEASAYMIGEWAGNLTLPYTFLLRKYGLSAYAQKRVMTTLETRVPYAVESMTVRFGKATLAEAYWLVEIDFENNKSYHSDFFDDLDQAFPPLYIEGVRTTTLDDVAFSRFQSEAALNRMATVWNKVRKELGQRVLNTRDRLLRS